jgi:putative endonuclease
MSDWHFYLIRTGEGHLYAGITTDVVRRLEEHRDGGLRGARALRGRGPLQLAYGVRIGDRSLALRVERRIKDLPKRRKEEIVTAKPGRAELLLALALEEE